MTNAVRIDKWLWAARFFRTRARAKAAIDGGKVHLNDQRTKAAKEVKLGDKLAVTRGEVEQIIVVEGLSERRGGAPEAALLYLETEESVHRRESLKAQRRMERAGLTVPKVRPSKKDRRELIRLKEDQTDA